MKRIATLAAAALLSLAAHAQAPTGYVLVAVSADGTSYYAGDTAAFRLVANNARLARYSVWNTKNDRFDTFSANCDSPGIVLDIVANRGDGDIRVGNARHYPAGTVGRQIADAVCLAVYVFSRS